MAKLRTYKDTLDYLYQKLPMYQREGASAYKKDLTNTLRLCKMAGNPQEGIKCIHIAGTNGKGTTSHIIAAGLQAQGYKTGVYTSPHYKDFRERIKINGQYISLKYITQFINTHQEEIEKIQPSFFELTVVLAFSWFKDQQVDYAVIETGLGGRLDSTNVITPILSIITNISFDHQNLLGDTLEQIAGEKAGIIKPETPVIIGETQEDIKRVFMHKAKLENAPVLFADKEIQAEIISDSTFLSFQLYAQHQPWRGVLSTTLSGPFQIKNIVTGMFALKYLCEHIPVDFDKVWAFMKDMSTQTVYLGSWQLLGSHPMII
ncbi:MAG TPA: Mur ligase family protein, partial [Saprospiraceae bacterium]|nr:Mur ligase family protein [Saprospiraceae bacterium]